MDQGGGKSWINEIYVQIHTYLCTHTELASGLLIAERERNLVEEAQTVERTKWQNQVCDMKNGSLEQKKMGPLPFLWPLKRTDTFRSLME